MYKFLFVFLLLGPLAYAETKNDFNYVEVGYAKASDFAFIEGEDYGNGPTFSASWQFQPHWFLAFTHFASHGAHDEFTRDPIDAEENTLGLGYIFHTTKKTDWYGRIGRVHRDLPGDHVYLDAPLSTYTPQVESDSTSFAIGARHRLSPYVELSWSGEALIGDESHQNDFRGIISPRFYLNQDFSLGLQLSLGGDLMLFELIARFQF